VDVSAWFLGCGEAAKPKRKEMEDNNKKTKNNQKINETNVTLD
jgi:hypothetical protein